MSLEMYCRGKRLVVLDSQSNAYDAARALESNHIGAIIVQDAGRIAGIVTDRDLALRVLGFELPPTETRLADIMTPHPATLSLADSEAKAIELMRDWHVRRLPIVEDERVVGLVTLDDLILSGAIDLRRAAEIVEAQLAEPANAKPGGSTHPTQGARDFWDDSRMASRAERHASRAEQTLRAFMARLEQELGLHAERALSAFDVVAACIVQRLTPQEARHFVSQLPSILREDLLDLPAGPNPGITRAAIEEELADRLGIDSDEATRLVRRIGASIAHCVSRGEVEDVVGQLPRDMKEIFLDHA